MRHWSIAISLLKERNILWKEVTTISKNLGYQHEIYQDESNYFGVGHSLGCKYITLLEFLRGEEWEKILEGCIGKSANQYQQIENSIQATDIERPSIKDRASLLIAPNISDTESAIPHPLVFLAHFLDKIGLGILPTKQQTQCFIEGSHLFNLTALISFDRDDLARNKTNRNLDVFWLIEELKLRNFHYCTRKYPVSIYNSSVLK